MNAAKHTHTLDISKGEKMPWWRKGDPTLLPLVKGSNYSDFDVVVDALPPDLVERLYDCSMSMASKGWQIRNGDAAMELPLGVDIIPALEKGYQITVAGG